MTRKALLLCVTVFSMACDSPTAPRLPPPTQPVATPAPPPAPAPTPTPPLQTIEVGQEVKGVFVGNDLTFELTVPADGKLVAELTWDVWSNGTLLTMELGGSKVKPTPPNWSPLVGTWSVTGARTYRLIVGLGGTDWFPYDPFVLKTAMQ